MVSMDADNTTANKENDTIEKTDAKTIKQTEKIEIDIFGPLTFWLMFLIVGLIIQLVLIPVMASNSNQNSSVSSILIEISGWILYLPGSIILPLIVGVWMGEKIGATKNKIKSAISIATINAIYTAIIYAIAIFIIYLLIYYITPGFIKNLGGIITLAEFVIIIPILIIIILVPLIASMSAARHKNIE